MEQKIMIVGVGGVGGVLAGQLVKAYGPSVALIARGRRRQALLQDGLTLHSDLYGHYTVRPEIVTEDPATQPIQDVILICVKNDALEQVCTQIAPVVGPNTILAPIMNGVSAGEVLRSRLQGGIVLDSVIYTVSSAGKDFSITQKGNYTRIIQGSQDQSPAGQAAAETLDRVLKGAGIECKVSPDIQAEVWKKYILNCAYNVATARWGATVGQLKADPQHYADCRALMEEAWQVAKAKGVNVQQDMVARHMVTMMDHSTPDSDSSLSRDFDQGRRGEMEVFSGYLVREAQRLGVAAPVSQAYYQGLQQRAAAFDKA